MDYFPKLIELNEFSDHSEPVVQLIRLHEYNRFGHVKVASEALDYIKNVKPIPGKTVILVLAMTAGEFYGNNRNGDAWPERPLRVGPTEITAEDVLPKHYHTFETNANVFQHHINKDPAKSIGQVLKAFYNWPMHRVELLLALDNDRAEDHVQRIERGEFPAVSMGCKVKFDVCSLCGNKAPSRKDYCDHARDQLGELLSNGKRVFVWNPSPKFFDISLVRRPADRLGFMMKKVAEAVPEIYSSANLGEHVEDTSRKVAAFRKLSLIHKILSGQIGATKTDGGDVHVLKQFADQVARPAAATMPPLSDAAIQQLIAYRPAEVLSTLSSMGIVLTTPEFIRFFIRQAAPHIALSPEMLDRAVAAQRHIFDLFAEYPELVDEIEETGYLDICPKNVNPVLAQKLGSTPLRDVRSQQREYLYKRALVNHTGDPYAYTPGDFDLVNVTDPQTGNQYTTTKSVAARTHGLAQIAGIKKMLGSAALLAGGAALYPYTRAGTYLAASGLGKGLRSYVNLHHIDADTGDPIHRISPEFAGTELIPKTSAAIYPGLSLSDATIKIAMDMAHCPRARNKKVAHLILNGVTPSFEDVALRVGEAICPDL